MKKQIIKKVLVGVLALSMLAVSAPFTAFAAEEEGAEGGSSFVAPAGAVFTTKYAYDCQRSPAYPTNIGSMVNLSDFKNPYAGTGTEEGPWSMVYVGTLNDIPTTDSERSKLQSQLNDYKGDRLDVDINNIPIYNLYQGDKKVIDNYSGNSQYFFIYGSFGDSYLASSSSGTGYYFSQIMYSSSQKISLELKSTTEIPGAFFSAKDVRGKLVGENPYIGKIKFDVTYDDFNYIYDLSSSTWTTAEKDFTITNNSEKTKYIEGYENSKIDIAYTPDTELAQLASGTVAIKTGTAAPTSNKAPDYEIAKTYTYTLGIANTTGTEDAQKESANALARKRMNSDNFSKIGDLTIKYMTAN